MKYTTKYLKQLLTENNITYRTTSAKNELLFQLYEAGILKREDVVLPPKPIDPKYEYLHSIRTHPKKVIYRDMETGDVITYDSIHKASKATKHGNGFYLKRNRQDGKYMVTVEE